LQDMLEVQLNASSSDSEMSPKWTTLQLISLIPEVRFKWWEPT
jgi:hypothetical protein